METWQETSGIAWLHREQADAPPEGQVAGVVLGRGYAHQSVATLGAASTAGAVLRRELARPVETGDGRVLELRVQVDVDLQDTTILLQGEEAALRRGLERLDAMLRDPASLDLTEEVEVQAHHPFAGWGRHLGLWFGVGPASLSADIDPPRSGEVEVLRDVLAALHPAHGAAAVGITTLESLVGAAFDDLGAPGARGGPDPLPLVWCDQEPGSVDGDPVGLLLSARSGLTASALLAERVLLETIHHALTVNGAGAQLSYAAATIGGERLLAVRASQQVGTYDAPVVAGAVLGALEAAGELADDVVERHVLEQRAAAPPGRVHPVELARDSVRSGRRRSSQQVMAEIDAVTAAQVRADLALLLGRVLVSLREGAEAPPGRPIVEATPPEDLEPREVRGRGTSVHKTVWTVGVGDGSRVLVSITRRGEELAAHVRPRTGPRRPETALPGLDLTRIAARIDQGDPGGAGSTMLIDARDRRVSVPWPALRYRRSLRRVVDRAVPEERTLVLPDDARWSALVQAHRRRGHKIIAAVGVLMALVVLLIIWGETSGEPDSDTTITSVSRGDQVELSNGTSIIVSTVTITPATDGGFDSLAADVRLCGGGTSVVDGEVVEGRNYVSPSRFSLERTTSGPSPTLPPGAQRVPEVTLGDGECVDGTVAFDVPAGTPDVGIGVVYSNAYGDQVVWRNDVG